MRQPAKRKWSAEEAERAYSMKKKGISIRMIAAALGRTEQSVDGFFNRSNDPAMAPIISAAKARSSVASASAKVTAAPIPLCRIMRRCSELGYGVDYGRYTASREYQKDIESGYFV